MTADRQKNYSVGIIGGGKVGLDLFRLFFRSNIANVSYVVDRDLQAQAIAEAKKEKVDVFDSIDNALKRKTDFVLEVTGSDRVVDMLREKMNGSSGELITHNMAFIILQVIDENNRKMCGEVSCEVGDIKQKIDANLNETETMIENINKVTSEMRILALNARIEAARVGDAGRGFALVAEQMSKLADSVREIARSMEQVTESVRTTSGQIETSINRLK
jgi:SpoVK/Ycf46/Vps4 family AAA+-type ATPase